MEIFRQRIFRIRDELFDYASAGYIQFDHPAYGELRTSMNSVIRFAHKISLSRAVAFTLARQIWSADPAERRGRPYLQALQGMENGNVKQRLTAFHNRVLFEVFRALMPGTFVLFHLVSVILRATTVYSSLKKRRDELAEAIEVQAIECDDELAERRFELRTA